jgi:hypothetical protein
MTPGNGLAGGDDSPFAKDHQQHVATRGAERETDGDLVPTLCHRMREGREHTDGGGREREPAEQQEKLRPRQPMLGPGLIIGLVGAFAAGRILQGLLIQTSPTDPVMLVFVAVLLVVVSVAACFLPARRAANLEPVRVLRAE